MNVAFIGMGTMGAAMALNILKAGHDVTVNNRTREREVPLAKAGARRADSPQEASRGAEIVVTCVSDTPDVEEIVLGKDGVIHGAAAGTIVSGYVHHQPLGRAPDRRRGQAFPGQSMFMERGDADDSKFIGEDIISFRRMKKAGIPLHAHTGALVKHMKRFSVDYDYYALYWANEHLKSKLKEQQGE